ncbi:MAG: 3-keto-5-aminohexanoate cleavage protein [Polynucleobacter sp.]
MLCESNAQLVSRAKRIIGDLGGQLASSNEARQMLGL